MVDLTSNTANIVAALCVPEVTKNNPYFDDFDDNKNYMRILFQPDRAVQSREMTQVQTILQNQVERFGKGIFQNGSIVVGGQVSLPSSGFVTLSLQKEYGGNSITAKTFLDQTIVLQGDLQTGPGAIPGYYNDDTSVMFNVIAVTEATDTDPPSLYGSYVTQGTFNPGDTIKLQGKQTFASLLVDSTYMSLSSLAFIRDSLFFINGFFVKVPAQVTVAGKYNIKPMCFIGLNINDSVVTSSQDTSLLDPAQTTSNFDAIGADRYQLQLELAIRPLDTADTSKFINLATVINGEIVALTADPLYSEIGDVLAKRTYDLSGNFTVNPFGLFVDQTNFDSENYATAVLSPGLAYVYGYRIETVGDTDIQVPKGRDVANVAPFVYNLNYGNYVIVNGLHGLFDYANCATFDIHCAATPYINTTSNTTYQQTRIGSAKVNFFNYYGDGGNANIISNREYEFYIFDTKFQAISSNANTVSTSGGVGTITLYNGANLLTNNANNANCYVGATVLVTNGPGSPQTYHVASYNATSQVITLDKTWVNNNSPTNTSTISLNFDFSEAVSFYINTSYTTGASSFPSDANASIMSIYNSTNGFDTGSTVLTEPSLTSLVFKMPNSYLAANLSYSSFSYSKRYTGNFVNGQLTGANALTANTNEIFAISSSTSNISSIVLDNIIVVVTNKSSSGRANGDIVSVNSTVTSDVVSLYTGVNGGTVGGDTFTADIFTNVNLFTSEKPKTKTLVQSNTLTMSAEAGTGNLTGSSTGSTANVFLNAGQVAIINPSANVGAKESLYISDVLGIDAIYDLAGTAIPMAGNTISSLSNVIDRYQFNNGQHDAYYGHSSIQLLPGYTPPKGPLIVCGYYFQHTRPTGAASYFSIDSYFQPDQSATVYSGTANTGIDLGDGYTAIPSFTASDGSIVQLRDSLDFRPSRTNGDNTSVLFSDVGPPIPGTNMTLAYSYYQGRIDLIVLTAQGTFVRVAGQPSDNPVAPPIPSKCMLLYTLSIPPYTEHASDIGIAYTDNRRYTERDIGNIAQRVSNLEYYVSLTMAESAAVNQNILDSNGLDRTKYGIFVDSFIGHALGQSSRPDYACAMDIGNGMMTCQANTTSFPLTVNTAMSSGVTVTRDKTLLNYNEVTFIQQPNATKYMPVVDFVYGAFNGTIVTVPQADLASSNIQPIISTSTSVSGFSSSVEYTSSFYTMTYNSQSRLAIF